MADVKATLSKDEKTLILEIPFSKKGKESKSGKSITHASTRGNASVDLEVNGKTLTVGINAYTEKD